jgi:hypothetical protein
LIQKDIQPDSSFIDGAHDDSDLSTLLQSAQNVGKSIRNASTYTDVVGSYYAQFVNGFPASAISIPAGAYVQGVGGSIPAFTTAFTYMCFYNTTSIAGSASYLGAASGQFAVAQGGGNLYFYYAGTQYTYGSPITVPGVWNYIAIVGTIGGNLTLYYGLAGHVPSSVTLATGISSNSSAYYYFDETGYNVDVCEVSLWANTALTPSQIAQEAQSLSRINVTGLTNNYFSSMATTLTGLLTDTVSHAVLPTVVGSTTLTSGPVFSKYINLESVSYPESLSSPLTPAFYTFPSGFAPSSVGTFLTPEASTFTFLTSDLQPDFTSIIDQYMIGCATQPQAARLAETLDINIFSPPPLFNSNTLRKLTIKDQLNPYYRVSYPTAHYAYTNYNALNFFTASVVPESSVLLYPNIPTKNVNVGVYTPLTSWSFDFYINPRYQPDEQNGSFKPGCIMHLSSTFALSLISGSAKDVNGRTSGFRLQLQLSCSADIPPSYVLQDSSGGIHVNAPFGTYRNIDSVIQYPSSSMVFISNDNVLQHNHWHHVVVRWGTNLINHGSGTFNVDGTDVGSFVVPCSSISPTSFDLSRWSDDKPVDVVQEDPDVLCLGNFYEGSNNTANAQAMFFATDPATRDGLNVLLADDTATIETPPSYAFNHPLNAELHNVSFRTCYLSDLDIATSSSIGPVFLDKTFAFFVPPFFVEQSPYRQFVDDHGGLLVTPFEEVDGTTYTPFSVALSFGVAGHYINLENFVKDFAAKQFPMLHHLTGVALQSSTPEAETCNEFLYSQPFVAKRNLTILPCDDGNFVPSFQYLQSESLVRAIDDLGIDELSFIGLDNMVSPTTLMFGAGTFDDGSQPDADVNEFANIQIGATPETPFANTGPAMSNYINTVQSGSDVEAGAPLTVYQRTQDPSSNEVVVFDASNMFYGFRISPTTFTVSDQDLLQSSLLGSNMTPKSGPIRIKLADDGRGNVYRADCLTTQATWNSVGNLYYDEGLAIIKSPHLYFFGQNQWSMYMRGEQHVHVMKLDALAPSNQLNSSSNPCYLPLPPTGYPNDPENKFVYVSNINFHDKDLNVVLKTSLAQPIAKRQGDAIMFKCKFDF